MDEQETTSPGESGEVKDITWLTVKKRVGDLKFHPKNPHIITEEGVDKMDYSINKFGQADPLIVNLDNVVISGHKRLIRYLNKGLEDEQIDVRVPDRLLTPQEHEEMLLIMRKFGEKETDYEMLLNNWSEEFLKQVGYTENELTGFYEDATKIENDIKEDLDMTINDMEQKESKPRQPKEVTCPNCNHKFIV